MYLTKFVKEKINRSKLKFKKKIIKLLFYIIIIQFLLKIISN